MRIEFGRRAGASVARVAERHTCCLVCSGVGGMRKGLWVFPLMLLLLIWTPSTAPADQGQKFTLFGTAQDTVDPQNASNDVIAIDTSGGAFGGAIRGLNVQVTALRNQLQFKAYFTVGRSCGGGSPRIQLAIDTDGNGLSNGNAFGYFGPSPNFTGCPLGAWQFEDLTDGELEWDLTQFGGPFYNSWSDVEAFFAAFPNHKVLRGSIVDDTFPGSGAGAGVAFYDLVTIGDRTLDDRTDTLGN